MRRAWTGVVRVPASRAFEPAGARESVAASGGGIVESAAVKAVDADTGNGGLRRAISRPMLLFFILGDILGAGIYALVGAVAGEVGGAVWTAFMAALILALFTAFAYAELITKYPRAGGAALFVNRAYRVPFVTFLVTFAVMASGITSASTLSRAFAGDYLQEFISVPTTIAALVFIGIVALINFRGIRESVRTNVVLTLVEVTGLVIIVVTASSRWATPRRRWGATSSSSRATAPSWPSWPGRPSPSTR